MTDETEKGGTVSAAMLGAMLAANAGGVGEMLEQTVEFIDDKVKSDVITIEEPGTGLEVIATVRPDGNVIPLSENFFDSVRPNPRFRRGTARMTALDSFIIMVNRFGDDDSVVFADDNRKTPSLTAVLDYNRADGSIPAPAGQESERGHGEYRHGKHRVTHFFPVSDEWKAWTEASGTVMSMLQFSNFLDKHIGDIAHAGDEYPESTARFVAVNGGEDMIADYAKLVELARGLKVHEDNVIEEAQTMATGEGHIRFTTTHTATRNGLGDVVKVPTMFFIAIPIFNKGAYYRLPAALRYRKTAEGVKFWFDLWREDRAFDDAFNEAVHKVQAETNAPVLFGAPEA